MFSSVILLKTGGLTDMGNASSVLLQHKTITLKVISVTQQYKYVQYRIKLQLIVSN